MLYVIEWMGADPSVKEKKQQVRAVHVEFVARNAHRIIASGGFSPTTTIFPMGA